MSTPMVGRSTQLDALREAFADGRAGHPRIVVVRGEAGIGYCRPCGGNTHAERVLIGRSTVNVAKADALCEPLDRYTRFLRDLFSRHTVIWHISTKAGNANVYMSAKMVFHRLRLSAVFWQACIRHTLAHSAWSVSGYSSR